MVKNLEQLGINPSRGLIIAGNSTGSDMAMGIAHLYAQEQPQGPPLTGLYLACPMAMNKDTVPEKYRECYLSMEHNVKAPSLTAESVEFVMCKYGLAPRSKVLTARSGISARCHQPAGISDTVPRPLEAAKDVPPGLRDGSAARRGADTGASVEGQWRSNKAGSVSRAAALLLGAVYARRFYQEACKGCC